MPKAKRPITGIIVEHFQTANINEIVPLKELINDIVKRRLKALIPAVKEKSNV